MENYTIYIIGGALLVLYIFITVFNKNRSRDRKSRKFMEDYKRKDKDE
ncbi:hypothetical protein MNBD_BACTEROID03-2604 [hydrothermal vent metagenome]|uniref:Uncharacterized protein n=1 Tax=hydrothermal vent metagenome TaxID=652676 RepID=A0A3B0T3R8_9ZZZZ